jgi:hypothetical protein
MVKERKLLYGNKNAESISSPRSISSLPSIASKTNPIAAPAAATEIQSPKVTANKPNIAKLKLPDQLPPTGTSKFSPKPQQSRQDATGSDRYQLRNDMDQELEEKIHREIRKREGTDLFMDTVLEKLYHVSIAKHGGIKKLMKMVSHVLILVVFTMTLALIYLQYNPV